MTQDMPQGKETVSDEEIIKALRNHEDPFIAAAEIADHFGHTRQWAHNRLKKLHADGRVKRKEAGERSVIWWVT
jgi:DNA-binding Lrp family transcriptional regulator